MHCRVDTFQPLSCDILLSNIYKLNKTTCDPFPTKLLMFHLSSIISIILCIVNLCFSSGVFPASWKSEVISSLVKKQALDCEILKNYRPVANFSILIVSRGVLKQCYLHNNMDADCKQPCIYYCYLSCDHC